MYPTDRSDLTMKAKKIAYILLVIGTALLIPTVILAVHSDSPASTALLVLSILTNAAAVNILILGAQHKRRAAKLRRESQSKTDRGDDYVQNKDRNSRGH